jgi:hypothetical protein
MEAMRLTMSSTLLAPINVRKHRGFIGFMQYQRERGRLMFSLQSSFSPSGDQPQAIADLIHNIKAGQKM